jgi:photosystem II stability/assembly factor-like uncharacterized protein
VKIKYIVSIIILTAILDSCARKLAVPLKEIQSTTYSTSWEKLDNYPIDNGRSDDLHFFDPSTGFVINSQGYLSYTEDGGQNWEVVHENKGSFFRCITFKNRNEGWLGTIGTGDKSLRSNDTIPLYQTKDGGKNWLPVKFIGPKPTGLCGLQKVSDQMIVGAGRVRGPAFFIKTNDGGETWYSHDLSHLAGSLIATHFLDEQNGFLIGGTTNDKDNSRSLMLKTSDGGENWDTIYVSKQIGEYPWKFSFPTKEIGFVSIQRNVRDGSFYHLQTSDGGENWSEVEHSPNYYYTQGIGFIDKNIGWIGGDYSWTYETRDGGNSWKKLKNAGRGYNNFQFFGDSLAYGVGYGVYKNTDVQKAGQSHQMEYYSDGEIRGKYNILNGKRNGKAIIFHHNGIKAGIGTYKNNLKKGKWQYFDEEGSMLYSNRMKHNGTVKVSTKTLETYVGNYEAKNGDIRKISLENGLLYSQRGKRAKQVIFPETETRFFYGFNPDITIEFLKNDKNEVIKSSIFQTGKYVTSKKIKIEEKL